MATRDHKLKLLEELLEAQVELIRLKIGTILRGETSIDKCSKYHVAQRRYDWLHERLVEHIE